MSHSHHHRRRAAPELPAGAGVGKLLFFDCPSGVAGDMTLAALLDLGLPRGVVEQALDALPIEGFRLEIGQVHPSGIAATTISVHLEAPQPERSYREIDDMLQAASLAEPVRERARAIFRRLAEAEGAVHGIEPGEVHLHEVGAVDAIVDVVGTAAALCHLGATVVGSPLPMGHGLVEARHGVLPLPAPATVGCLAGVPTYGVDLDAELVTPTGAAILSTVAARFERWPRFAPERSGWGAGSRTLADRPNLLRLVLGAPTDRWAVETHLLIEANVDDLTGELAAEALEQLRVAGAVDAWAQPIVMKKGRPALTLAALVERNRQAEVRRAMLRHTSTIGLRVTPISRQVLRRELREVRTPFGVLPVKVSHPPDGPPRAKPEFDACAEAARKHGVPVSEVLAAAVAAFAAGGGAPGAPA